MTNIEFALKVELLENQSTFSHANALIQYVHYQINATDVTDLSEDSFEDHKRNNFLYNVFRSCKNMRKKS